MNISILDIPIKDLIDSYLELKSSYKVAKKYNVSATAVKRVLKQNNVLRNQITAANERPIHKNVGKYERTESHRKSLSDFGKTRLKDKNPFYNKKHTDNTKKMLSNNAKDRTGKRNPNYKSGSYKRRPRDFKISEFTPIRNFVFNRDDYTCKYCKSLGGHLHAHHIIPYWVLSEAFLDPDNLVTVCTTCHFTNAHNGNWHKFDTNLITLNLIKKYKLDRERLNELAANMADAIVRTSDINKTEEIDRNDQSVE